MPEVRNCWIISCITAVYTYLTQCVAPDGTGRALRQMSDFKYMEHRTPKRGYMSVDAPDYSTGRHRTHLCFQVVTRFINFCRPSFFFSSRRRHTRLQGDWSSDVCSSD